MLSIVPRGVGAVVAWKVTWKTGWTPAMRGGCSRRTMRSNGAPLLANALRKAAVVAPTVSRSVLDGWERTRWGSVFTNMATASSLPGSSRSADGMPMTKSD